MIRALALSVGLLAAQAAAVCCPDCPAPFLGKCPVTNELVGLFQKGSECVAACPGSCTHSNSGYTCGLEPCGPDPCPTSHLLRSKPLGFCAMGTNSTGWPQRTAAEGYKGSYAFHVALAQQMQLTQQSIELDNLVHPGESSHILVNPSTNSIYVPVNVQGKRWTLHRISAAGNVDLQIDLGTGSYPHSYAASDEVVLVGHYSIGYTALHWTAYDANAVNKTLSDYTDVPVYQGAIPFPAVVHGTKAHVLIPDDGHYTLFQWDATVGASSAQRFNVSVSDCNSDEESADVLKSMWVNSDASTMYFTAENRNDPNGYQLCKTSLSGPTAGVTSNLLPRPYTKAFSAVVTFFFDDSVAYSAASGTSVQAGGTVVCTGLSATPHCTWLQHEFETNVKYTFTDMYTGYHIPVTMDHSRAIVMYKDVVVYQTSPGVDLPAVFAYNLTSGEIAPVALPYVVPNTECDYYTGDNSASVEEFAFSQLNIMANGTLVLNRLYSSNTHAGQTLNTIVSVNSAALRPDMYGCKGGCSVHGGLCVNGECQCVPGCMGTDCSKQAFPGTETYCDPQVAADDDW